MKEIHKKAAFIFTLCIALIALYLVGTLIFALDTLGCALARALLLEMLHSAAISALLTLGGVIILDIDLGRR